MNTGFNPRTLRRIEQSMRLVARDSVDRALANGECDLVELASALPVAVICDLLGVPASDREFMLAMTRDAFGSDGQTAGIQAHSALLVYYSDLVRRRRRAPADDVVSSMIQGLVEGKPLSDIDVMLNCDGLISGGNETTRHATVGGLLALYGHPDQLARLSAEPALMPSAISEVLRWTSPALHVLRTATADCKLAGQTIRAGDRITVWIPSANQDEQVFDKPAEFRIDRANNRHLTFATGNHTCIGAALATAELRILIGEVVGRVAEIRPLAPARRLRSNLIRGYQTAPVELIPRPEPLTSYEPDGV